MLKHKSLLAAAFLAAAYSATAQTVQPQGKQPTPKRLTKAEKKAAKRARNAGVTVDRHQTFRTKDADALPHGLRE